MKHRGSAAKIGILLSLLAFIAVFSIGCKELSKTFSSSRIETSSTMSSMAVSSALDDASKNTDPIEVASSYASQTQSVPTHSEPVLSTPTSSAVPVSSAVTPTSSDIVPVTSRFEVHFIDVGQADAALVLCDDKAMLIDGGNSADSNLIYTYLKNNGITYLDYIVGTHGHEDHIGGLSGALNFAQAGIAYCPVRSYNSKAFDNFLKYLSVQGKTITVPSVGDVFNLGSATVRFIGVNSEIGDANNTSIVLRIEYGATSFLFTGDAEREAEQVILESGLALSSTVLKVGHHGSDTSTTYPFLREVMPKYAVISVGKGNTYGHPSDNTLSRLRDAGVKVFRTDMQGDVICKSDGKTVSFTVKRNKNADTLSPSSSIAQPSTSSVNNNPVPSGTSYILNNNTKKFHYPHCSSADRIKDSNRGYYTGSRDYLIAQGYSPCGNCHP